MFRGWSRPFSPPPSLRLGINAPSLERGVSLFRGEELTFPCRTSSPRVIRRPERFPFQCDSEFSLFLQKRLQTCFLFIVDVSIQAQAVPFIRVTERESFSFFPSSERIGRTDSFSPRAFQEPGTMRFPST